MVSRTLDVVPFHLKGDLNSLILRLRNLRCIQFSNFAYIDHPEQCTSELWQYVCTLQQFVITILSQSITPGNPMLPNFSTLLSTSNEMRTRSVNSLTGLYQRLAQAAPITQALQASYVKPLTRTESISSAGLSSAQSDTASSAYNQPYLCRGSVSAGNGNDFTTLRCDACTLFVYSQDYDGPGPILECEDGALVRMNVLSALKSHLCNVPATGSTQNGRTAYQRRSWSGFRCLLCSEQDDWTLADFKMHLASHTQRELRDTYKFRPVKTYRFG